MCIKQNFISKEGYKIFYNIKTTKAHTISITFERFLLIGHH